MKTIALLFSAITLVSCASHAPGSRRAAPGSDDVYVAEPPPVRRFTDPSVLETLRPGRRVIPFPEETLAPSVIPERRAITPASPRIRPDLRVKVTDGIARPLPRTTSSLDHHALSR